MKNLLNYFLTALLLCFALITNAQVYINEVQAHNASSVIDEDFYNFTDWIELYNAGSSTVDISGYAITDDTLLVTQWVFPASTSIPANGFLIVWADGEASGLHTDFKLDGESDFIALLDGTDLVVDSVSIKNQLQDISYGRIPDGSANWQFLPEHTHGVSNGSIGYTSQQPANVQFSVEGGFYWLGPTVSLISDSLTTEIRFTTDGSMPDKSSFLYTEPIAINSKTVVRARPYGNNMLPGNVSTQTYLIYEHHKGLPVFCIATDPKNLTDDMIGIYVEGTNGITGRGSDVPVNWNQDWERPVNIEFYDAEQKQQFNKQAGIEIFGGWSRRSDQKSLSVKFSKKYSDNDINYSLFSDRENTDYRSFILRNSGNDFRNTQMRDGVLQKLLFGQMDIDLQAFEPAVLYINGRYWGIQNIRERYNRYYCEYNHGVNPDSVDIVDLDGWYDVKAGSQAEYDAMITYLENNDITLQQHYDYIKTQMDVGEFMNYNIVEIYYRNHDWPVKNNRWWQPQGTNGKWRWMLFDLDITTGIWGQDPSDNSIEFALSPTQTGANAPYSTYLFRRLMENQEFKDEFIRRFIHHINTTFNPERVNYFIDKTSSRIEGEIPYHYARWSANANSWSGNVETMKNWCNVRPTHVMQHLSAYFSLGTPFNFELSRNLSNAGAFVIDGYINTDSLVNGILPAGHEIELSIKPQVGFAFDHWEIASYTSDSISILPPQSVWKYLDDGTDPGTSWKEPGFNDALWTSGQAQLGYNEGDENTLLDFGPDENNKYISYYFRNTFNYSDTGDLSALYCEILKDDGAVVYLNGNEIIRTNMTSDSITYLSLASIALGGTEENSFMRFTLPPHLLLNGPNIIAVEVHQASANSSDVGFDLSLYGIVQKPGNDSIVYDESITFSIFGDTKAKAVFVPTDYEQSIFINEILAQNAGGFIDEYGDSDDWIEIYNKNTEAIDIGGWFISDASDNFYKWQIPIGFSEYTTIEPDSFIILWADNEPEEGPLHLGFKLDKEGEEICLYYDDGTSFGLIDSVWYSGVIINRSYGRYTDGEEAFYYFNINTPGRSNILEIPNEIMEMSEQINIYPNPASEIIHIDANALNKIVMVDILGSIVFLSEYQKSSHESINISHIEPGTYFLIIESNNKTSMKKVIVN